MKFHARLSLFAPALGAILFALAAWAPGAQASSPAPFGVESFFAANCKQEYEGCKKPANPAEEKHLAEVEGFSQAGGHPPWGVTDFRVSTHVIQTSPFEAVAPNGIVTYIRTDVAPGVSTNPEIVAKCSLEDFGTKELPRRHGRISTAQLPGKRNRHQQS